MPGRVARKSKKLRELAEPSRRAPPPGTSCTATPLGPETEEPGSLPGEANG
jgi:hypothetical protein